MPSLNYAPKPALHRRRAFRWLTGSLLALAIVAAVLHWGPNAYRQAKIIREQRNWIQFHAPADQLVLLEDQAPYGSPGTMSVRSALASFPDFKVSYLSGDVPYIVGRSSPKLNQFLSSANCSLSLPYGDPRPGPILYCGARRGTAGQRLIVISFYSQMFWRGPETNKSFQFSVDVFEPAGIRMQFKSVGGNRVELGYFSKDPTIQFFAGQPDVKDESKFTIAYTFNGIPGTIEGRLSPEGRTVTMTVKDGPLGTTPR